MAGLCVQTVKDSKWFLMQYDFLRCRGVEAGDLFQNSTTINETLMNHTTSIWYDPNIFHSSLRTKMQSNSFLFWLFGQSITRRTGRFQTFSLQVYTLLIIFVNYSWQEWPRWGLHSKWKAPVLRVSVLVSREYGAPVDVAGLQEDGRVMTIKTTAIFKHYVNPVWTWRWQLQMYMEETQDSLWHPPPPRQTTQLPPPQKPPPYETFGCQSLVQVGTHTQPGRGRL